MFASIRTTIVTAALAVVAVAGLSACTTATAENAKQTQDQLAIYNQVQPVPSFDYSMSREVMTKVITARATGVATTTFWYVPGVAKPIKQCASKGYPIPATTQITSPDRVDSSTTVAQMEPDGVYLGETTATYVVCVGPNGEDRTAYAEEFVHAEPGTAVWNPTTEMIELR